MDVSESTQEQSVVTIDGIKFDKGRLVSELSMLRFGGEWDGHNEGTLRKMKEAGLVRKKVKRDDYDMSVTGHTYEEKDGKCAELFEKLTQEYVKYRVKVSSFQKWGPFDESETEDARERALERKRELEKRNPDVEFEIDEEELRQME